MTLPIPRKAVSYTSLPTSISHNGQATVIMDSLPSGHNGNHELVSRKFKEQSQESDSLKRNPSTPNTVSRENNGSGTLRILLLCSLITIPMGFLSIFLLLLVSRNRITDPGPDRPSIPHSVFIVDADATTITTLTSFMSTFSTWIASPAMLLLRYPIAHQYMKSSISDPKASKLPTPFQLSILVALLSAQLGSLWEWLKYKVRRGKRSSLIAPQLSMSAGVLLVLILLSAAMSAADTWFHLTTRSINFTQSRILLTLPRNYGREISTACLEMYVTGGVSANDGSTHVNASTPCSIQNVGEVVPDYAIQNETEAIATGYNDSSINSVLTMTSGSESYAVLTAANVLQGLDFVANTLAASTQCISIASECGYYNCGANDTFGAVCGEYGAALDFHCPLGNFSGTLSQPFNNNGQFFGSDGDDGHDGDDGSSIQSTSSDGEWTIGYVDITHDNTTTDTTVFRQYPNQSNYTWILVGSILDTNATAHPLIFSCNTSIWNVSYSAVGGEYNLETQVSSNWLTALTLNAPITSATWNGDSDSSGALLESRFTDITSSNSSLEDMADQIANAYSTLTMAFAAGIVSPIPNLSESNRTTTIVTQVSRAPLFTLTALTAVYVIGGIVLTAVALCTSRVDSLQSLLSLAGITAAAFEQGSLHVGMSVKGGIDRYEEAATGGKFTSRISVERSGDGFWQFRALDILSKEGWNK